MSRKLVVIMKGYPRLSETFIAQEILSMERAGFDIDIVAMREPHDVAIHPVHREIRAPVRYVPEYLHDAPLRVVRSFLKARKLPGFAGAWRAFRRDLGRDFSRDRVRRLGQAAVLAAEMPAGAARLHVHFIHTPASVTRYASMMTGLPWSCSAHAKDIWTTTDADLALKLAEAEFTVTCTKSGLERLNRLAPPDRPARLVYHGLDLSRFRPLVAPRAARTGADPDLPVRFLTVARAVEKKGLDTMIDALARLPEGLAWTWTHIGGGPLGDTLRERARRAGLTERCRFLGARPQEDVIAAYAASDVFVLPCRVAGDGDRDGLPNVLMEAGSQGLALVSTAVAGVAELIDDGSTGVMVPPDDPDALAAAMARLAVDPAERYRLGKAASAKIFRLFDHDIAVRELIDLFPPELRGAAP
jgi:glycosyltransferase involved in cell wall biosynthesis